MALIQTVASGNWSDPSIWDAGVVPGDGDTVIINAEHTVTIDQDLTIGDGTAGCIAIDIYGKLLYDASVDRVLNLKGSIVIRSDGVLDWSAWSTTTNKLTVTIYSSSTDIYGIACLNGGTLKIIGYQTFNDYTEYTAKLAQDAVSGDTQIVLNAEKPKWKVGDKIVIGTNAGTYTIYAAAGACEVRTITAISGTTITLDSALTNDYHKAGAYVVNMYRNIQFYVNDPNYTSFIFAENLIPANRDNVIIKNVYIKNFGVNNFYGKIGGLILPHEGGAILFSENRSYPVYSVHESYGVIQFVVLDCDIYNFSYNFIAVSRSSGSNYKNIITDIVAISTLVSGYASEKQAILASHNTIIRDVYAFGIAWAKWGAISSTAYAAVRLMGAYSNETYERIVANGVTKYQITGGFSWQTTCGVVGHSLYSYRTEYYFGTFKDCESIDNETGIMVDSGCTVINFKAKGCYGAIRTQGGYNVVFKNPEITNCQYCVVNAFEGSAYIYDPVVDGGTGNWTELEINPIETEAQFVTIDRLNGDNTKYFMRFAHGYYTIETTVVRTSGTYVVKMIPSSDVKELIWRFKIPVKANYPVAVLGYLRKTADYTSGYLPRIVLYGAGIPETESVMEDVTDQWSLVMVAGTPTRDGWAIVDVKCKGTSGTVYVADLVVATTQINVADAKYWSEGTIPVIVSTGLAGAIDVWNVPVLGLTVDGSIGKMFKEHDGILNRETIVKSDSTIKVRFKSKSGNAVKIYVYKPDGTEVVSGAPMTEVGTTGIYYYDLIFDTIWGTGDFLIKCVDETVDVEDSMTITVVTKVVTDLPTADEIDTKLSGAHGSGSWKSTTPADIWSYPDRELTNPDNYKADVSDLAKESTVQEIRAKTDKLQFNADNDVKATLDGEKVSLDTDTENLIRIILGLVQHNYRLFNTTYTTINGRKKLTSATVKIYNTKEDCDNDNNPIKTYTLEIQYDNDGYVIDYKSKEV